VQLYKACNRNDLTTVQALVESCEEGTYCGIVNTDCYGIIATPLHVACYNGNTAIVKYLLESDRIRVDVNLQDDRGVTVLHHACHRGNISTVKYLVESDHFHVDVNIRDDCGNMPLHSACMRGHKDIAEYFMQSDRSDVDVNAQNNRGQTLLHLACKDGNRDLVEYLLESDRIHVVMEDNSGNSLLHHACEQGQTDVLKYLVQSCQVDVEGYINKQNNEGDTPVHVVCWERISSLRCLLESDDVSAFINPNIRNNSGDSLLHMACRMDWHGAGSVISCLVQCDKIDTESHIRTQNNHGDTPLHLLCSRGRYNTLPFLKLLMEEYQLGNDNGDSDSNEMNIDEILKIQNSCGNTPLHLACNHQKQDVIRYLLQSYKTNSSLNIQNHAGNTPFHIAFNASLFDTFNDTTRLTHLFNFIQHQVIPTANLSDLSHLNNRVGDTVITKRLIEEAKPIANIQNRNGDTLLHLACVSRESGMLTLRDLVGHDSVNATLQNRDGDTALHCICHGHANDRDDCVEKMKLLIESSNVKVDVNTRNIQGDTPLHCVVKSNCLELFEYLMTLEMTDPSVRNKAGDTASEHRQKESLRGSMSKLHRSNVSAVLPTGRRFRGDMEVTWWQRVRQRLRFKRRGRPDNDTHKIKSR